MTAAVTSVDPCPLVSVIIPVRNQPELLAEALRCLSEQTYPTDRYEIIIVDDGSTPPARLETVEPSSTTLIRQAPRGCYAARNSGAAAARGEVLAFTDADCRAEPNWLRAGVSALRDATQPELVAGRILMEARDPTRLAAAELFDQLFYLDQRRYVARHCAATANLFVTRRAWDAVGGFEVGLQGDFAFTRRAQRLQIPLRYAAEAVVRHPACPSASRLVARRRRDAGFHHERLRRRYGLAVSALLIPLQCLPPLRRYGRVFTTAELQGARQRLPVAGCVALSHATFLLERVRLLARSGPRQAGPAATSSRNSRHRHP